jgi:hypothetical protein
VAVLVALLAATQYRSNRVGPDGSFLLDVGEHVDTAVHVGVTWELVAGYPPQVPGLAGVPMRYHVGSHLVRAAAVRWAGIHPYDSLSRFDVTLWGIALREWRGTSRRTHLLIAAGLAVLVASTLLVGYGNYLEAHTPH